MSPPDNVNAFPLAERAEAAADNLTALVHALRVEDPTAWSTAHLAAGGFETIARLLISLTCAEPPTVPERPAAGRYIPMKRDDEQVRSDFRAWARTNGFDLSEHPLHALFLDRQTQLSWQAWKAAASCMQWGLEDGPV